MARPFAAVPMTPGPAGEAPRAPRGLARRCALFGARELGRYGGVARHSRALLLGAIVPLGSVSDRGGEGLGIVDADLVIELLAPGRESESLAHTFRGARREVERETLGLRRKS